MRKPATPAARGLTAADRRRLARALAEAREARLYRRLQAVLLVAEGRSVAEAAHVTGLSRRTVYHLINTYTARHEVEALYDRPRTGRPAVAQSVTPARILRELDRSPLALGYRTNVWTVELLVARLAERYGCAVSPRTLRRRMRQVGLRCKRPRYVYSEKEPHIGQKKGRLSGS
jgi:transposase